MLRSQSADLLPMEIYGYIGRQLEQQQQQQQQQLQQQQQQQQFKQNNYITHTPTQTFFIGSPGGGGSSASGLIAGGTKKMVKQLSNASQQSSSSTSSSVQSAPSHIGATGKGHSPGRWTTTNMQHVLPVHHEQSNIVRVSESNSTAGSTSTTTSAASVASSHSDTTVEDGRFAGGDDISLTGSIKKRKRRLRFPFGRRKSNESNNNVKNKLA